MFFLIIRLILIADRFFSNGLPLKVDEKLGKNLENQLKLKITLITYGC